MEMKIPLLTAKEVECRIQQITGNATKGYGAVLLLYKDARVDMKVLDKVFGAENWQRRHTVINGQLFCSILVWDETKSQWIEKQDVGTESQTEAEKGRASDSFKRAGFNWGIGRELYNAPFIYIPLDAKEVTTNRAGKPTTYTRFAVTDMRYDEQLEQFTHLVIVDDKGRKRYELGTNGRNIAETQTAPQQVQHNVTAANTGSQLKCAACGAVIEKVVADYSRKKYGKELCRKCQAHPQPAVDAKGNEWVKIENGTDYLVKNNIGNWLRVEGLTVKACELILQDPKYALAYEPVKTHMQALALERAAR